MSRYDLFRRRIAPVAFLLAIGLMARDSCEKHERTHTTVELDFGEARSRVRAVEVVVVAGDGSDPAAEPLARFRRTALPDAGIGVCRFAVALPGDDGALQIDVDLGTEHRKLTRRVHTIEGSTTRVTLADELLRAARE